ncbi:hypothetical protein Lesp02_15880 [Lentzea sp. NBRC 105346]|nr:hypothetical protein Lesp02_15880 [Lentzea sp. NBRC 105346]
MGCRPGSTGDGLPAGLQVIARHGREIDLLAAARRAPPLNDARHGDHGRV